MVFQIGSNDDGLFARRSVERTLAAPEPGLRRLVDTTMLFAPKSGGVKRYLNAKRAWFAHVRPDIAHTLVVPGAVNRDNGKGVVSVAAARLPFGDGYRWPTSTKKWADRLCELSPSLIEAGDPYAPGRAALDAGERLGVPVVGFCHSDPAQLAALHLGEWAEPPVRRRWARLFRRFDQVVAPSRHIAERLAFAGVPNVVVQPLGVDIETFNPARADPVRLRRMLGLSPDVKLLVFAGRPAREKNVDVMLETVARLGDGYHLLLIGAGATARPQGNATFLGYQKDPREVARLLASCDAFLHANPNEPFGLVALEAMACGLPMVATSSGGVSEIVDESVGRLAPRATAHSLAQAVEALFEGDLQALGAAARARVEALYGWDAVFTSLTGLYERLTGAVEAQVVPLPTRLH
ncbi:glycosyltransferase family 1 protein [soil metagenome]